MRIDHLVLNVDSTLQKDNAVIQSVRDSGFPYEPAKGKGASGFKVSNLWLGNEYFEMVRLLREDGGNWKKQWVEKYNQNHRGLICLYLDTNDIQEEYNRLAALDIGVTPPAFLKFKLFFNLLSVTMPWQNAELPFFEGVPFQLGFQQMKDEKSRNYFRSHMHPNSNENGIEGISRICIWGMFTTNDFEMIKKVFLNHITAENQITAVLSSGQELCFIKDNTHKVEVQTICKNSVFTGKEAVFENLTLKNAKQQT